MIDPKAIKQLRVYPPIGVARVGNAEEPQDYVIGPEVIGGPPTLPGDGHERPARFVHDFRTGKGLIKRQAARFRIYAHLLDGSVQEVTASDAQIEWRVSVANLKAGWYEFNQAMDLGSISQNAKRRNREFPTGKEYRARFDIVPRPQTVSGRNAPAVAFDDGVFFDQAVYLGELRTDAEGRLLFLGGKGDAAPFRDGLRPLTFANNDGWHDDLCDGPVRATITFDGHAPLEAEAGYVTVTPPNYAPGLFGLVTMDDVAREVFYCQGWLVRPDTTLFSRDVLPIFQRLTGLQWVNHGLFIVHGHGSALDTSNPDVITKLGDSSAANAPWRNRLFDMFRDPSAGGDLIAGKLPQIFGDGVDKIDGSGEKGTSANGLLAVCKTQFSHLERWSKGDFTSDATPVKPPPSPAFAELSPAQQIENLERASLTDCLGGPFHPAMEMTWVMRIPRLWISAYRLKVLPGDGPAEQDFGEELSPARCTGPNGPYDGAAAGCLTRFLGVPWHTDHTSCNSAADYYPMSFLSMPTFWGPRAPDQVLAEGNYLRAAALSDAHGAKVQAQTFKHLFHRVDWLRDIRGQDYYDRLSFMIKEWAELGMVLPVENAPDDLPVGNVRVEQGRNHHESLIDVQQEAKYALVGMVEDLFAAQPVEAVAAGLAAGKPTMPPPKRSYRQGEI